MNLEEINNIQYPVSWDYYTKTIICTAESIFCITEESIFCIVDISISNIQLR